MRTVCYRDVRKIWQSMRLLIAAAVKSLEPGYASLGGILLAAAAWQGGKMEEALAKDMETKS